jgi:hypothetical protein
MYVSIYLFTTNLEMELPLVPSAGDLVVLADHHLHQMNPFIISVI